MHHDLKNRKNYWHSNYGEGEILFTLGAEHCFINYMQTQHY